MLKFTFMAVLLIAATIPAAQSQSAPSGSNPAAALLRAGITPYQLAAAGGTPGHVAPLVASATTAGELSRADLRQRLLHDLAVDTAQRLELLDAGRKFGLSGPASLGVNSDQDRAVLARQVRVARRAERLAGRQPTSLTGIPAEVLNHAEVQRALAALQNEASVRQAFAAAASNGNP
ncbi:MAG TPA: hypothetical protein VEB22_07150 [Phycisphaerales bacterium]|nr:hypothetical protein [Phycisphaerales bacterium]